jgi:hypothetical protein
MLPTGFTCGGLGFPKNSASRKRLIFNRIAKEVNLAVKWQSQTSHDLNLRCPGLKRLVSSKILLFTSKIRVRILDESAV